MTTIEQVLTLQIPKPVLEKAKYKGATVIEPHLGVHMNPIAVGDFQSLSCLGSDSFDDAGILPSSSRTTCATPRL